MTRTLALAAALTIMLTAASQSAFAQALAAPYVGDFGGPTNITQGGLGAFGSVAQMAFAPGDNSHLYVSTFANGVWRFDYSEAGVLSNGSQLMTQGSLGIAFHDDATLGTVMYVAPAVPFGGGGGFATVETQSILRVTDTNNDGTWGGAGDVNQAVVDNLRVTRLHQVNQLQVDGDRLYVAVGSSTQTGGDPTNTAQNGDQSNPGETQFTGGVAFINDLTLLSGDTATANTAGFTIANQKTDTQGFTSTDDSKLRVFSTGFRNNYGIAVEDGGQLWVSMNENENPLLPDAIFASDLKDDHGFEKHNDQIGDWKTDATATGAGYFQTTVGPHATLGNHAAAGGFDFLPANLLPADLAGDILVSRWVNDDILIVDPVTGATASFATGFNGALDVLIDPFGNILIGTNVSGQVWRIAPNTLTAVPTPAALPAGLALIALIATRRRRHH